MIVFCGVFSVKTIMAHNNSEEVTSVWSQPPRRSDAEGPSPSPCADSAQASAPTKNVSSYDSRTPRMNNHTKYNMRGSRVKLVEGSISDIPSQCYGHLVGRGGEFARSMTTGDNTLTSYHVEQQKRKRDAPITIRMKAETQEIMDRARSYLLSHIDSYFDRRD